MGRWRHQRLACKNGHDLCQKVVERVNWLCKEYNTVWYAHNDYFMLHTIQMHTTYPQALQLIVIERPNQVRAWFFFLTFVGLHGGVLLWISLVIPQRKCSVNNAVMKITRWNLTVRQCRVLADQIQSTVKLIQVSPLVQLQNEQNRHFVLVELVARVALIIADLVDCVCTKKVHQLESQRTHKTPE